MKVEIVWIRPSGYLIACLRGLASRPGVEPLVSRETAGHDAPFDDGQFFGMAARIESVGRLDRNALVPDTQSDPRHPLWSRYRRTCLRENVSPGHAAARQSRAQLQSRATTSW
jgi:hypothetical protein